MMCHFDLAKLMTHLKLFWCQSDVSRKMGAKPYKCTNFRAETLGVEIERKSCCCDRVDLTICVNAFLCQLDTRNKLGPKTLNVHRFQCQGLLLDF
jgi:hypothetical protein